MLWSIGYSMYRGPLNLNKTQFKEASADVCCTLKHVYSTKGPVLVAWWIELQQVRFIDYNEIK